MIILALFEGDKYKITEQALDASWFQQKVISNNISNVDTPDFKAKTMSFGLVLDNAVHAKITGGDRLGVHGWVTYETNTRQTLNGNNVDMEKESDAMLNAQYQYSTLIDYLNSQYQMIRIAIGKA